MSSDGDERAPLLQFPGSYVDADAAELPDSYKQYCMLIGHRPDDYPKDKAFHPPEETLYYRALRHRKNQGRMYAFTAALTNTLLLSQIVLGAALTGLGASGSSRVLVTTFGALNTVIAGLIAFLKSRGQPMRARMFRDDLDRVVDEIENGATMWRGISRRVHGYDAIDTDEAVTVRSEVARLTRLYDRAVKVNTMNDPDFYGSGISQGPHDAGLRNRTGQTLLPAMPAMPANLPAASGSGEAAPGPAPGNAGQPADPDEEGPATKDPAAKKDGDNAKDKDTAAGAVKDETKKPDQPSSAATNATPPPVDPDESPATSATPAKSKDNATSGDGAESNGVKKSA